MKQFLVTLIVAVISTVIVAQTRSINYETDNGYWSELSLHGVAGTLSNDEADQDFSTFGFQFSVYQPLSRSNRWYADGTFGLNYSSYSKSGVDVWWFAADTAIDLGYLITPSSSFSIYPFAGITFRYDSGGQISYNGHDYDLFDKDEGGCHNFQAGWRIGYNLYYKHFMLGFSYGSDFLEFADDTYLSGFDIKLGYTFKW